MGENGRAFEVYMGKVKVLPKAPTSLEGSEGFQAILLVETCETWESRNLRQLIELQITGEWIDWWGGLSLSIVVADICIPPTSFLSSPQPP